MTGIRPARVYSFEYKAACNMCGADVEDARILGLRLDRSQGRRPLAQPGIGVTVCRCRRCDLVFSNPQPVPNSIDDHYGIPPDAYWRDVNYDPAPGYFSRQIDAAKELLKFKPGMKAIDIGIGLGKAARVMRDAGFDVYGIEPSEPFYKKALELLGGDTERYKFATVESAEFEESAFDFVTFGAVLEHLYDPSAALAKAVSWLKPGGVIHAEIPNSRHLVSKLLNAAYRGMGTNFVTNLSPMHVPFHLYEFSTDSFSKNGERNGYEIAGYWVDVASIYNVPRVLHPILRRIMARQNSGLQLTVFLRKRAT